MPRACTGSLDPLYHPGGGLLRVGAVPVAARRAVRNREYQEHYEPYQRYQVDEDPPSRAVNVVEPPHGYGQGRYEHRQVVEATQQANALHKVEGAEQSVDQRQHDCHDDVEQYEIPVLRPPGPAAEHGVLLEYFQVPTHPTSSLFGYPPPLNILAYFACHLCERTHSKKK